MIFDRAIRVSISALIVTGLIVTGLVAIGLVATGAIAAEQLETDDFRVIHRKALEIGAQYGVENVLLVFDLDNTLLAMDQALGSDPWFRWQAGLLRANPCSPQLVGRNFQDLLRVGEVLSSISAMHPPDPETLPLLADLQARGFTAIVLTARGTPIRDATLRVLTDNGYNFTRSALPPAEGFGGSYLPYDPDAIGESGITAAEGTRFGLGKPRPVSYQEGVFMVAGQHKGAMLRMLLHKTGQRYAAIVFADDRIHNTDAMYDAFAGTGVDIITFRFSREDPQVRDFQDQGQEKAQRDWQRLRIALDGVFGKRWMGIRAMGRR